MCKLYLCIALRKDVLFLGELRIEGNSVPQLDKKNLPRIATSR